jgi:hypothetical protein
VEVVNFAIPDCIADNSGICYPLSLEIEDNVAEFKIRHNGKRIAIASLVMRTQSTIELADIRIEDQVFRREVFLKTLFRWITRKKHIPINYRRKGIGSKLLTLVISFAKAQGYSKITGKVTKADFKNNPQLLDWYRKFGFDVRRLSPSEFYDVANITLHLSSHC